MRGMEFKSHLPVSPAFVVSIDFVRGAEAGVIFSKPHRWRVGPKLQSRNNSAGTAGQETAALFANSYFYFIHFQCLNVIWML